MGCLPRSAKHSIRKVPPPAINVLPFDAGQDRLVEAAVTVLVVFVIDVADAVIVLVETPETLLDCMVVEVTRVLATILGLDEAVPAISLAPSTPLLTSIDVSHVVKACALLSMGGLTAGPTDLFK
jgi:hypothetical protein